MNHYAHYTTAVVYYDHIRSQNWCKHPVIKLHTSAGHVRLISEIDHTDQKQEISLNLCGLFIPNV